MDDLALERRLHFYLGKSHPIDRQHCLLAHSSFYLQTLLKLVPFLSIQTVHSVFQLISLKMVVLLRLCLQQDPLEEGADNLEERLDEIEVDA